MRKMRRGINMNIAPVLLSAGGSFRIHHSDSLSREIIDQVMKSGEVDRCGIIKPVE